MASNRKPLPVVGWREWVALPDLKVAQIKAKVDTGARSSCLHAFDIEILPQRPYTAVRFKVHPIQHDRRTAVACEAPLLEERWVRSSNGKREYRPVIRTTLEIDDACWPIELTLTSRDSMGFRMLLGREAIRKRFVVDSGASFVMKRSTPKPRPKT